MGQPSLSGSGRGECDCRPLWGCIGGQLDGLGDAAAGAADKRDAWAHRPSELGWVHIQVQNY